MKVLYATSEIAPWVKTGGLADVSAALPLALRKQGADVRILIPNYPAISSAFPNAEIVARFPSKGGQYSEAIIRCASTQDGTPLYLLECNGYYARSGSPYVGPDGRDWTDNGARFGLLSQIAALLAGSSSPLDWSPDILHCNDWQTGLAPAYLHYNPHSRFQAKSILTVHNLAFQGLFDYQHLSGLGLPDLAWAMDGVEYHGWLSFLKAGLQHADQITTVSTRYANEIQNEAEGMGLSALLRYRAEKLTGIRNGIDSEQWNPATDPFLKKNYDSRRYAAKAYNTKALRTELNLAASSRLPRAPRVPLIGLVSRLTHQKGVDLVADIADQLPALPAQLVILGTGEFALERRLSDLATKYPESISVRIGFDERLAHLIEAGADMFLMPSRFEPCGLNQMYSMRYGTLPIVRATGGLADTVIDAADTQHGNGFAFEEPSAEALMATLLRANDLFSNRKAWRILQKNGMQTDWGWGPPSKQYLALYERLMS